MTKDPSQPDSYASLIFMLGGRPICLLKMFHPNIKEYIVSDTTISSITTQHSPHMQPHKLLAQGTTYVKVLRTLELHT